MFLANGTWTPTKRIGGSDIAKLLGISKYGNAANVYERIVLGLDEPWNPRMERGAAVESELRAYAQNHLGLELEDCDADVHASPAHLFAWAQVDDIGHWRGLPVTVDYKSQSQFAKGWGADGAGDVPEIYETQMRWELMCTERDLGLLIVGFGEDLPPPDIFQVNYVATYEIQREPQWESFATQVAKEFWTNHVLPKTPPAMAPIRSDQKRKTRAAPKEKRT